MKKIRGSVFLGLALILCLALTNQACVMRAKDSPEATRFSGIARGCLFEIGEIKAEGFETAPYLPDKIRFELVIRLRERGLLAEQSETEKRLAVNIKIKAEYSAFASGESYSEIKSDIQVNDVHKNEIIANTVLREFNAWGSMLSDSIEIMHTNEIADFLESIVR